MPHETTPSLEVVEELEPDPYFDYVDRQPFRKTIKGAKGTTYIVKEGQWPRDALDNDEQRLFIALPEDKAKENKRAMVVCFTAVEDEDKKEAHVELLIKDHLEHPADAQLITDFVAQQSDLDHLRGGPEVISGPAHQVRHVAQLLVHGDFERWFHEEARQFEQAA